MPLSSHDMVQPAGDPVVQHHGKPDPPSYPVERGVQPHPLWIHPCTDPKVLNKLCQKENIFYYQILAIWLLFGTHSVSKKMQ